MLLKMAVAMARAVPDARFGYEEGVPTITIEPSPPTTATGTLEEDDIIDLTLEPQEQLASSAAILSAQPEETKQSEPPKQQNTNKSIRASHQVHSKVMVPKPESPEKQFHKAIEAQDLSAAMNIFIANPPLQSDVMQLNRFLPSA